MQLLELMNKRVICLTQGKELGYVTDALLSKELRILVIVVCEPRKGLARLCPFLFTQNCERINVECIVNIGVDVILVKK